MNVPKNFWDDLKAMIDALRAGGMSDASILGNVGHDIGGLLHEDDCFSPRCTGYAARKKERDLT